MPMARLTSPEEWAALFGESRKPSIVTIGNFDGVHRGHQEIFRKITNEARQSACMSRGADALPSPDARTAPRRGSCLADDPRSEALGIRRGFGIDATLVLPFNVALSEVGPEEFARKYLASCMRRAESAGR